jgi:hypothetical protein
MNVWRPKANSDDLDSQDHALESYRETFLMSQFRLNIILLFQRDFYFGEMNDIFTRHSWALKDVSLFWGTPG